MRSASTAAAACLPRCSCGPAISGCSLPSMPPAPCGATTRVASGSVPAASGAGSGAWAAPS
eukprot:5090338-Lingulodinium_polyedra.AAC.1